jgi:CubicO group peptidase (beta-lactamase class C family)
MAFTFIYQITPSTLMGTSDTQQNRCNIRKLILFIPLAILTFPSYTSSQTLDTTSLAMEIPLLMEIGDVPGLSIAIVAEGRTFWTGSFGTLNDSLQTPVNRNSIFSAASLSKPVFAYLVMRLAERGVVDLDQPLAELLENTRMEHDPRYKQITARMVLSHRTGLPNWGGSRLDLRFDPGTGFDYSGEGYVYLQRVIENITGYSLEALAQREVFAPLGMSHSSFVWQERFSGNAVYGKDWAWRVSHVVRYPEPNAAFSLLTTAEDYAKFVCAVLNRTGLGKRQVDAMLEPQLPVHRPWRPTEADTHVFWGLGWGLQNINGDMAFWHWGDNGPFKAYVVAYPEDKTGVVYLANSNDGLSISQAIVSHIRKEDHWALRWLNYTRHDHPQRLAIKKVKRAAVMEGEEAAIAKYLEVRDAPDSLYGMNEVNNLADFLSEIGLSSAALSILEVGIEDHPHSAALHDRYGEILLTAGKYEAAIAAHRRSLEIEPDNQDARRRIEWIAERLAVEKQKVSVSTSLLELYAGKYGPRRVRLKDGRLYYQREGNPEYPMIPLADDLFALEGLETFRLRFVQEGSALATEIIGIYINGGSDENLRTEK